VRKTEKHGFGQNAKTNFFSGGIGDFNVGPPLTINHINIHGFQDDGDSD